MNFGQKETFFDRHPYFFQNFSFNLVGLKSEDQKKYEDHIKLLGGTVWKEADYTLASEEYLKHRKNQNRTDLYLCSYIYDSIKAKQPLDINTYRFINRVNEADSVQNNTEKNRSDLKMDNENSSNNGDNKESIKRGLTPQKRKNIQTCDLSDDSDIENSQKLTNLRSPILSQNRKRTVHIASDDSSDDTRPSISTNLSKPTTKSNSMLRRRKKLLPIINDNSSDSARSSTSTINFHCKSSTILKNPMFQKGRKLLPIASDDSSDNVRPSTSAINSSKTPPNSKSKMLRKRRKLLPVASDYSSDNVRSSTSTTSLSKPPTNSKSPMSQKRRKIVSIASDNSSDDERPSDSTNLGKTTKNSSKRKTIIVDQSSEDQLSFSSEEGNEESNKEDDNKNNNQHLRKWYYRLPVLNNIDPNFEEPTRAAGDRRRGSTYSLNEKRLMIAYLVKNNQIYLGKSRQPWKQMHADGYMRNRSIESMSNNFRKNVLPNISSYDLPNSILKEFEELNTS